MRNKFYLNYFLQKVEFLRVLLYFFAFFIFIIFPVIKFYNIKEEYKVLEYHLYNNIEREKIIKKKLETVIKKKKKLEEKYNDDYLTITKKSFSSPIVVKDLALKGFKDNNLLLVTQYRLIKEKIFDSLISDVFFSYISMLHILLKVFFLKLILNSE